MSKCAFFVSAPTVRFLQTMKELRLLPSTQQRKIAADVYGEIKPLIGTRDIDELRRAAQAAQDERWRLVSRGTRAMTDVGFATVVVTEQWLLAQREVIHASSPVAEVLAEKRCGAIEDFIRDNISFEAGEVVQLHAHVSSPRTDAGSEPDSAAQRRPRAERRDVSSACFPGLRLTPDAEILIAAPLR